MEVQQGEVGVGVGGVVGRRDGSVLDGEQVFGSDFGWGVHSIIYKR